MDLAPFHGRSFAISLQSREDRYIRCRDEFRRVGWPVEFYRPTKDAVSGARGCFLAHQHLAVEGLRRQLDWIAIFEDDVNFSLRKDSITHLLAFREESSWDVLYLGHAPLRMKRTSHPHIARTWSNCTHAYLLSERGMRALAMAQWDGTPVDSYYRQRMTCYALYPMIAFQREDGTSDTDVTSRKYHVSYRLSQVMTEKMLLLFSRQR